MVTQPPSARQSEVDGQDTERKVPPFPSVSTFQLLAPPSGAVEVITLPRWLTPTQSDVVGQDIPRIPPPVGSTLATLHRGSVSAGFVEVKTSPLTSPTTQNEAERHDTAVSIVVSSTAATAPALAAELPSDATARAATPIMTPRRNAEAARPKSISFPFSQPNSREG